MLHNNQRAFGTGLTPPSVITLLHVHVHAFVHINVAYFLLQANIGDWNFNMGENMIISTLISQTTHACVRV